MMTDNTTRARFRREPSLLFRMEQHRYGKALKSLLTYGTVYIRTDEKSAEVMDPSQVAAINHEIAAESGRPSENAPYVEAARRDTYRAGILRAAIERNKP